MAIGGPCRTNLSVGGPGLHWADRPTRGCLPHQHDAIGALGCELRAVGGVGDARDEAVVHDRRFSAERRVGGVDHEDPSVGVAGGKLRTVGRVVEGSDEAWDGDGALGSRLEFQDANGVRVDGRDGERVTVG